MWRIIRGLSAALRGFLALIGFLVLLGLGSLGWYISKHDALGSQKEVKDCILTLHFEGPTPEFSHGTHLLSLLSDHKLSFYEMIQVIDHAAKNDRVKALVCRLDHGALGLAQIQDFHMALKRFRKTGKKAYAHIDTFSESGSGTMTYFLACGFDEIAVQPLGSLHVTGLGIEMPFMKEFLDQLGIKPRFSWREEYKGLFDSFMGQDFSPENKAALQEMLHHIFGTILSTIAKERELDLAEVQQLPTMGPLLDTADIKKKGLIDHVMSLEDFNAYIKSKITGVVPFISFQDYYHEVFQKTSKKQISKPHIALIHGQGTIMRTTKDHTNHFTDQGVLGSEEMISLFKQVKAQKNVKAIVLRLDTPGGSPVASETVRQLIVASRKRGVPVIVSMGNMAASGGYWIASSATKIVGQDLTLTGSIGVAGGKFVLDDFWRSLGITFQKLETHPNTLGNSPHRDFSEDQKRHHEASLDYLYEQFKSRIVQGRSLPREHVDQVSKGRVWTGNEAKTYGLVDMIGDLDMAISLARVESGHPSHSLPVVTYPKKEPFLAWIHAFEDLEDFLVKIHTFGMKVQTFFSPLFQSTTSQVQSLQ